MSSSWPFISHLHLGYRNFCGVATCPFLSKACNINSMCCGFIVEGEALSLIFFCLSTFCMVSEIQSGQFVANIMVSAKEIGT